jgi:hypothetical protein
LRRLAQLLALLGVSATVAGLPPVHSAPISTAVLT